MHKMTKFFNLIFLIIILFLGLFSLIALITIHWTLFQETEYSISLNPIGINNYLSAFGTYKTLFTATVTTIAAYLGLLRLKAATDANKDKLKQDRFNEWKAVLDIRFITTDQNDPIMKGEFIKLRLKLYRNLYDIDFIITNETYLKHIFANNFSHIIDLFESQNKNYIENGGIYPHDTFSYSFDSFLFLFQGCTDHTYPDMLKDLKILYLELLSPKRIISMNMYQTVIRNNKPVL